MAVLLLATQPSLGTLVAILATGAFLFCLNEWDPGRKRPSVLVRAVLVLAPPAAALAIFSL